MRISRDEMLMKMTRAAAERSTCRRLHVGALAARKGRPIATGYAGAPSGVSHCDETNCHPDQPCTRTVHAEAGLISFAARYGVALEGAVLYCTHSPCCSCAGLIANTGIIEVVYDLEYRKTDGIDLLSSVGILVRKYDNT